jgi:hypothetical protein
LLQHDGAYWQDSVTAGVVEASVEAKQEQVSTWQLSARQWFAVALFCL